jgi:hypothetical protein
MLGKTAATALALALLAAVPAGAGPRVAGVRVAGCSPAGHSAVFYARMERLPDARRMALRVTLLERTGAAGYVPAVVPGLSIWRNSGPGRGAFAVRQRVRKLTDGAAYRARVDFRWRDGHGKLLRSTRRTSRSCKLAGSPLPNLRARILSATPTRFQGVTRYGVRVGNLGAAPAHDVPVRFSVDGSEVNTRTVASLPPGESTVLFFRGPSCERTLEAVVDPLGAIPEGNESDNVHRAGCLDVHA